MIVATFTDPQTTTQTDAVLQLRAANYTQNTFESYSLDVFNFTDVTNAPPSTDMGINYSFYYWVNAAARASGAVPYILANSDEIGMDFSFIPDSTYDGLTLEAKCEKHLLDVILPPMQVV